MVMSTPLNIGCPYHGLIENGQLALPNGQSIVYPQPGGGVGGGSTRLVRMPWAPGLVRNAEQQARDTATGMQWTDYAILCGDTGQLHGKPLEGWIYAGPDGKPWLVRHDAIHLWTGEPSFSANFAVNLFGVFGAEPQEHSFSLSLTDTGQAEPQFEYPPTVRATVCDTTPAGDKALVMVYTGISSEYGMQRKPLGFWLITLEGTPGVNLVASIEMLKTRVDCMGVGSDTGLPPDPEYSYYAPREPLDGSVKSTEDVGSPPSCTGWRDEITTPAELPDWAGNTSDPPYIEVAHRPIHERQISVTGKIVAGWFDVTHEPVFITLDVIETWGGEFSNLQQSVSGRTVSRLYHTGEVVNGACALGGTAETIEVYEREWTRTGRNWHGFTFALKMPEGSQTWAVRDEEETTYYEWRSAGETEWTHSVTYRHETPVFTEELTAALDTKSNYGAGISGPGTVGLTADDVLYFAEPERFTFGPTRWATLTALSYCNKVVGLAVRFGPAGSMNSITAGPAATPAGFVTDMIEGDRFHIYGSFNPATNETVRHRDTQVCFT